MTDSNTRLPLPIEEPLRLSQDDFNRFARLSGDHNPIHVDPEFSSRTSFGATVSHGMLLFTVLRGLIARHYPDWRMTHQDLKFPAPAYADEALTLEVQLQSEAPDNTLTLATRIIKADGRACLAGQCRLAPQSTTATQAGKQP